MSKLLDVKTPTVDELTKKHKLTKEKVLAALEQGRKVEREHTKNPKVADEIARDHLGEKPNYYKLLKKYVE